MKQEIDDLETDDELIRVQSMTDGPKNIGKFKIKPLTAETLAWIQTVDLFDEEKGDIHRIAAYVIIHTTAKEDILPLIFNRSKFWFYVSDWISENVTHHNELNPYSAELNNAWDRYNTAISTAAHPSTPQGPKPKN